MKKRNKSNNQIPPKLLKALLEHSDGQELFGSDGFFHHLKQGLVEGILEGEIEHHIGYEKHDKSPKQTTNRRNGYSKNASRQAMIR